MNPYSMVGLKSTLNGEVSSPWASFAAVLVRRIRHYASIFKWHAPYLSLLLAVSLCLCACGAKQPPAEEEAPDAASAEELSSYTFTNEFDRDEAQRLLQPGDGRIQGSVVWAMPDGGDVVCSYVDLVPVTAYSQERMQALFDDTDEGIFALGEDRIGGFADLEQDMDFHRNGKKYVSCDGEGNFSFENLQPGSYYVTTALRWGSGENEGGCTLMKRVLLGSGETIELVLSN